jgi:hypothetical protein
VNSSTEGSSSPASFQQGPGVTYRLRRCLRLAVLFRGGLGKFLLDSPRQFVLPLRCHEGILTGHFQIAVAGDFGGFDRAATDLLPPSDVYSPERVLPQTGEIAALRLLAA